MPVTIARISCSCDRLRGTSGRFAHFMYRFVVSRARIVEFDQRIVGDAESMPFTATRILGSEARILCTN